MGTKSGDLSSSEDSVTCSAICTSYTTWSYSEVREGWAVDGGEKRQITETRGTRETREIEKRDICNSNPIFDLVSRATSSLLPPTHSCEGRRRFSRDFVGRGMFNDGRTQKRNNVFAKLRYITAYRDRTHRKFFTNFSAWIDKNVTRFPFSNFFKLTICLR